MTVDQINSALIGGAFTSAELDSITDAIRFARSKVVQKTKNSITLGTTVQFTDPRTHVTHKGTVNKIKIKNILVSCPTYGRGGLVNVPAHMLTIV